MESLHYVNNKQLFEAVKNYVSDPDADRPLLVIGHSGTDTAEIINRAVENCGNQVDVQVVCEDSNAIGQHKKCSDKCLELVDAYATNENRHLIIELTCECSGIYRKTIKRLGDKVLWIYCREDVKYHLAWARETLEKGGQLNNEEKQIQKAWLFINIANTHIKNNDLTEAISELGTAIEALLYATLDDEVVHNYVNHVKSLLWEHKDKDPYRIMSGIGALLSIPYLDPSYEADRWDFAKK